MTRISYRDRFLNKKNNLTNREREVGEYLLLNEALVDQLGIQQLAIEAGVSNATITRLAKKLDYRNFSELKSYIHEEHRLREAKGKGKQSNPVATYYKQMLDSVQSLVAPEDIQALAHLVQRAKKIVLVGIGSSSLTAMEAKLHLSRMGLAVDCISDPHMMKMTASLLSKEDLVMCFSTSGETQALIETVELAQKNQSTIAALTSSSYSQLAQLADLHLATGNVAAINDGRFINSQFTHTFILDSLCYELLGQEPFAQNRQLTLNSLKERP